MLLMRTFWPAPRDASAASPHYGGPGPDRLDELAAVLMESDAMADRRRALLATSEAQAQAHLQPMPTFLAQSHPMAAQIPALQAEAAQSGNVRVISGEAAQRLEADARWLYAQARGVADVLLASGDDPAVFGSMAAFLADGGDMDGWLAAHGAQYGLPSSIDGLDAAWTQWRAAHAPSPKPGAAQAR